MQLNALTAGSPPRPSGLGGRASLGSRLCYSQIGDESEPRPVPWPPR